MKQSLMLLLLIPNLSSADFCQFKGKVKPSKKLELVKQQYRLACQWFKATYKIQYDSSIKLSDVIFVSSWKEAPNVIISNHVQGFLVNWSKAENIIYVLDRETDKKTRKYLKSQNLLIPEEEVASVLYHEIIHFLVAKSLGDIRFFVFMSFNLPEASELLAYHAQNNFIQKHYNKTLKDSTRGYYIGQTKLNFDKISWWEKNPQKRFQELKQKVMALKKF